MSTSEKRISSHIGATSEACFVAGSSGKRKKGEAIEGNEALGSNVTVLVSMPMELKRKLHVEAKRRQQTLSELIRDKCDFLNADT